MKRAFSILEIKAVNEDDRVIEGIASTPTADRMGDIVEPLGAKFALPMPLLWQHDSHAPVGNVEFAKPTKAGIPFRATIAKIDEPGRLKDRVDEAWQSLKAKLVRAVSIGFRTLSHEVMSDGGWRFTEWEWLELSLVTIPANAEATITTIRSIDAEVRAASGQPQDDVDERRTAPAAATPPGVSGSPAKTIPVVAREAPGEGTTMKTIAEQIAEFEATRQAKAARQSAIMNKAADDGVTLDSAQSEEYDTLEGELSALDAHLVRLRKMEAGQAAAATPVAGVRTVGEGSDVRGGVATVKGGNLPKGTAFTRYAIALARGKGNVMQAAEIAKAWPDTPEVETVLKSAQQAGTTTDATWAAPLVEYQNMASEFVELLRPATIVGRIKGLREVPFNIKIPAQTAGSTVNWVGESKPKPVGELAFTQITLGHTKIAGIVVLSEELVRFSNPSAEALVRTDLINAIAAYTDQQFVDPDVAAVNGLNPASITNGVTPVTASGNDADALRADFKEAFAKFVAVNLSVAGAVVIMQESQLMAIAMMQNALGAPEFPSVQGPNPTLFSLPVIASESSALTSNDSPAGGRIIIAKASEILLADDGQVMLDVSREASLEMESTPDATPDAATVLVSLWQNNLVGLRAERFINWKKRRAQSVQWISGADYGAA